jgi:hypothetical protein
VGGDRLGVATHHGPGQCGRRAATAGVRHGAFGEGGRSGRASSSGIPARMRARIPRSNTARMPFPAAAAPAW